MAGTSCNLPSANLCFDCDVTIRTGVRQPATQRKGFKLLATCIGLHEQKHFTCQTTGSHLSLASLAHNMYVRAVGKPPWTSLLLVVMSHIAHLI